MTPSPGKKIRVAAFGAGWVTVNRHIPAMRGHGGYEIVAVVDRNAERARAGAEQHGLPWLRADSVADVLEAHDVDAFTCGTAPFAHAQIVGDAIAAGKHVLTEKPFTMTVEEGERIAAAAREHERVVAIVHNFQFARSMLEVKDWLSNGKIGTVRGVWAMQMSNPKRRLPHWFDELPLGLFYDESPHLIYAARALAGGELEPVAATIHPTTLGHANTPAQIDAQMRAGNVPVTLQMNFEAPLSEWHIAVMGDEGMGVVDLFRDIAVYTPNDRGHFALDVLRTSLSSTLRHWRGYLRSGVGHVRKSLVYGNDEVFSRFHTAAVTGEPPRDIGIDDALSVLRTQHWIVSQA
jgi:predicted dehydrogenase